MNHVGQPIGSIVVGWTQPPVPARKVMDGHYCRLEPLDVASHCKSLFVANQQVALGRNWTYLPYGPFDSLEAYRQWMVTTCLGADPLFFAIRDLSTDEVGGIASYLRIKPTRRSIEVGHLQFSPKLQRTSLSELTRPILKHYG